MVTRRTPSRRRLCPFSLADTLTQFRCFGWGAPRASRKGLSHSWRLPLQNSGSSIRKFLGASAAMGVVLFATGALAQEAPLIQPGAPGEASRALEGREAARIADNRYSADDVAFMQGMIVHHGQAVEMAMLAPSGPTPRPSAIWRPACWPRRKTRWPSCAAG